MPATLSVLHSLSCLQHLQGTIIESDALDAFVELLSEAQPDGQYSAAAALANLAAGSPRNAQQVVQLNPLQPLVDMLSAKSW